jgi:hypothetical protein
LGDSGKYIKIFDCPDCGKRLEATIECDSKIALFFLGRGPRSTKLSYTCPSEKVKRSVPITLNSSEYPFKRGKIVKVKVINFEKGARQ